MTNLSRYLAQVNRSFKPPFQLSLRDKEDRVRIRELLQNSIEPENLTEDGELTHEEVLEKFRFLYGAKNELDVYENEIEKKKGKVNV